MAAKKPQKPPKSSLAKASTTRRKTVAFRSKRGTCSVQGEAMTESDLVALQEELATEEAAVRRHRDRVRTKRARKAARANEKLVAEQREADVTDDDVEVRVLPIRRTRRW